MSTILDTISNNQVLSGLAVAVILALVGACLKWNRDRRNSQKIYDFMLESQSKTGFTFRSTEAISSATKIPEKRVASLCIKHPNLKRNEKQKQSWKLIGSSRI
jgi:hypothetical protein